MGALYVKDDEASRSAKELADNRRLTKTAAVKLALTNELAKDKPKRAVHEIVEELRRTSTLPPSSGFVAKKDVLRLVVRRRMALFVDASAVVEIVQVESEADALAGELASHNRRFTSAIALLEAARVVRRDRNSSDDETMAELGRNCASLEIDVMAIGADQAIAALHAQTRYGKGTGHPACLNMGDCFAYACAKTNAAQLLYKGNDFIHTDLK